MGGIVILYLQAEAASKSTASKTLEMTDTCGDAHVEIL